MKRNTKQGALIAHSPSALIGSLCLVIALIARNCCRFICNGEYFEIATTAFITIFWVVLAIMVIESVLQKRDKSEAKTSDEKSPELVKLAKTAFALFGGWLIITFIVRFLFPAADYYVSIYYGAITIVSMILAVFKYFRDRQRE